MERIREALPARDDVPVVVDRVPAGDRDALLRSYEEATPDVLHWIGHGVLDAEHGGRLLVESADGGSESVRPEQLAELLRGGPSAGVPSLVVLATCHSAGSGSGDAMAAVAPGLARAGVPSVVAMRDAISDEDAIRFTRALYASLAQAEDIAAAVSLARRNLLLRETGDSGAWAIPVLYQSADRSDLSSWRMPLPPTRHRRRWPRVVAALGLLAGVAWMSTWRWTPSAPVPEVAEQVVGNDPRCPGVPGLDLPMIYVEPGSFDMGSTIGETDERPVHRVALRDPYCLGRFEVTVEQWNTVLPDDAREVDGRRPVTHTSWDDAMRFVGELNRRVPSHPFRLPTEAEWEFAARAGTDTTWSFGDQAADLLRHGNCSPREGPDGFDRTAPVGSLAPNPWGFFDMHGNVTEWVADGYGPYPDGNVTDALGPAKTVEKVRRGGNFLTSPENCSSSRRYASERDSRIYTTGLRLAADPE